MREDHKLSKLSVSAIKWTFVRRFSSTEDCLAHLEKNRFVSIVTSPHVKGRTNVYLDEGDYTEHAKLAVWFGNEARGISNLAVERSAMCVAIPMFGMIESLNLGTSSGIVLYEIAKQRRAYQSRYKKRNRRVERETPLPTVIVGDRLDVIEAVQASAAAKASSGNHDSLYDENGLPGNSPWPMPDQPRL